MPDPEYSGRYLITVPSFKISKSPLASSSADCAGVPLCEPNERANANHSTQMGRRENSTTDSEAVDENQARHGAKSSPCKRHQKYAPYQTERHMRRGLSGKST
eukprot:1678246-Pyramimonas_sp.AAC.1